MFKIKLKKKESSSIHELLDPHIKMNQEFVQSDPHTIYKVTRLVGDKSVTVEWRYTDDRLKTEKSTELTVMTLARLFKAGGCKTI